jgi:O-antigen/teichoic acid export membrane protein
MFIGAENFAIATRKLRWANEFRVLQAFPRAMGVGVAYYIFESRGVGSLALAGSVAILLGGAVCMALAWSRFPRPSGGFDGVALSEGIWFAGNQIARAGQQNIDRVVLGGLVEPSLLAVFGAAQRFVQVGILPIQAILRTTYPSFFARGHEGIISALRYGSKVLLLISAVAGTCATVLWLAAMYVPTALGSQFGASASYLRWLAPSLLLVGLNYVAADILTGSDHQRLRTSLMMTSIIIQAGMFALFHEGGQLVLATYAGIGFAAASNWIAVLYLAWRERRSALPLSIVA